MKLLEEFSKWLRQWYREEEVAAMLEKPWSIEEGVNVGGRFFMGIEEFFWHAATFVVERTLRNRGRIQYVVRLNEVYAFDIETRTVLIAARYKNSHVEPKGLNAFLEDMERQARDGEGTMSIRKVVD